MSIGIGQKHFDVNLLKNITSKLNLTNSSENNCQNRNKVGGIDIGNQMLSQFSNYDKKIPFQ